MKVLLTWHDWEGDAAGCRVDLVTGGADVESRCFSGDTDKRQDASLWKTPRQTYIIAMMIL